MLFEMIKEGRFHIDGVVEIDRVIIETAKYFGNFLFITIKKIIIISITNLLVPANVIDGETIGSILVGAIASPR
ncbi:hypothetical protein D3C73_654940 [compost metagenome]